MRCDNCNREITEDDVRIVSVASTCSEPGYDEQGCRFCSPSQDDEEAAKDAYWDRKIDEYRERDL